MTPFHLVSIYSVVSSLSDLSLPWSGPGE